MRTTEETWNNQRAFYAINLHLGDMPSDALCFILQKSIIFHIQKVSKF